MNEQYPGQPDYNPSEEANIRQIMEDDGVSFDEARQKWEAMKVEANLNKMKREEEENNG